MIIFIKKMFIKENIFFIIHLRREDFIFKKIKIKNLSSYNKLFIDNLTMDIILIT